ncbi:MFS transporter [Chloroflexota bacterium]
MVSHKTWQPPKAKTPFYGYIVVVAAFIVMMMTAGTFYSFGVFFKPLLAEFGWTRAMTSGAYSLCILLAGLLGIGTGRLTDRFGPRLVATGCGFLFGLGFLSMSQINTLWQVYLFYGVILGIGMSGTVVPMMSTVTRWFVRRRGMMIGITASGVGVGTLIMPPIANWLVSTYGWRISYIVIGIAVLILIILAAQFMKRDPGQLGQLPYGEAESGGGDATLARGSFSLRQAMQTRQLWLLCIALFFFGISLQTILVHIVPHTTDLEITAASAAFVLAIIGGTGTGGRVIMGMAADRIGNKLAFMVSYGLISAALFWLLFARELWMLYLFAVIFGFGYGGIAALISPVAAHLFGLNSLGTILGVIILSGFLGETIGPIVTGHIFDITGSYNLAFLTCTAISFISLTLASVMKPVGLKVQR